MSTFQYLLVLAGCALAAPAADEAPYGPPAPVYKPKPAPYKEPDYKPQPYEYKYGVADDYSKSAFDKVETQDAYGKVVGSYKVNFICINISPTDWVSRSTSLTAGSRWSTTRLTRMAWCTTSSTRVSPATPHPRQV